MTAGNSAVKKTFVFTGWHMLAVMVTFFGTIIAVNMFMAWNAVTSWSGLVVPNTYVASQQFNGKAAAAKARAATGIVGALTVTSESVEFIVSHPQDGLIDADTVALKFIRPVGESQNFRLDLAKSSNGIFIGEKDILPGQWIVESIVMKDDKVIIHEGKRISVTGSNP